jgi:hypothetical protein
MNVCMSVHVRIRACMSMYAYIHSANVVGVTSDCKKKYDEHKLEKLHACTSPISVRLTGGSSIVHIQFKGYMNASISSLYVCGSSILHIHSKGYTNAPTPMLFV